MRENYCLKSYSISACLENVYKNSFQDDYDYDYNT